MIAARPDLRLSVIITSYNIETYIDECLASVADQTTSDFEVLVVDDGSSDSTPAKIIAFCEHDPRFTPVLLGRNSPGGVATAANAGLDRARGRWVGFVDGDDYVEPTMFERLVDAAETAEADLAICDYLEVVDDTGDRRDPADAHRWAELTSTSYRLDVSTRRLFLRFIAVPWRKLYRRDFLEDNDIRFPVSDGFYEDNPFHWFVLTAARSIAVVPEVLCYHRIGRAGQTMATADERLFGVFAHHDTIHAWLAARKVLDVYETALLGWVISQLEWISRRTPSALRRRLFDTVVPIFANYSTTTLAAAYRENNKGATTQRLCSAVAKRDYAGFARSLSSRPGSNHPLISAAYHLRHSGLPQTAVLAGRYARHALQGSKTQRRIARISRTGREPSLQDVMFGLMIIQHRLQGLEDRLREVQDQQSRLDEERGNAPTGLDRLEDPVRRP